MKMHGRDDPPEEGNHMNHGRIGRLRAAAALAVAAAVATGVSGCASTSASESQEFTIWWYSADDNAHAVSWAAALEEFKADHPELTVNFELKTWDQIQQSGNSILDSDKAPDLAEWNKGNSTAGVAAQAGLLTNLNDYAAEYGWDTKLPGPLEFGRYTDGVMGSGDVYGVPAYGEYVSYFYNADMLAEYGVEVPTTFAELESAMQTFVDAGVTPLAAADYMLVHLAYLLTLNEADTAWRADYQSYAGEVDFNDAAFTFGSETLQEWVEKGFLASNATGASADDAVSAFTSGAAPFMPGGSWLDAGVAAAVDFEWGKFLQPGNELSPGSAGNIWVVPARGKNPDLAAEFIELTLSPKYQNLMATEGGLPLLAEPDAETDATTAISLPLFTELVATDGLGWYPDWPAAGYYDVLKAAVTDLVSGSTTPQQYRDTIGSFYTSSIPGN
jgi:raffinose/stachyose/melibiose transport system substrate-binding protein